MKIQFKPLIKYFIFGIAILIITTIFNNDKIFTSTVFGAYQGSPLRTMKEISNAVEVQNTFRKIYDIYKDRVVFISTEQTVQMRSNPLLNDPFFREFFRSPMPQSKKQKRTGLGTGFVLSEDGYICTNHHVVAGVDKIKVKIEDVTYNATLIGSDKITDIALLKIKPKKKLHPVYFGDSDKINVGDWAIAIGNPFGLDRTFTVGVISATARKDLDFAGRSESHIQTDASINPGNSGGPLINIYGEVIGINRMIYSKNGGNMGIGFAIPVNHAKKILEQLKQFKKVKRGFIGVQIVPFTEEYAQNIGLKDNKGALVGGVIENSPADRGGVKIGDVILAVNDTHINDYSNLLAIIEKTPIGKSIKLTVIRNKSKLNLFITITERGNQ